MAAGIAVIASRIGDIDGLIKSEVTGLLCTPGDAVALSVAFVRLHFETDTRLRLGAAARAVAKKNLGWDRVADTIIGQANIAKHASGRLTANAE